MIPRDRAHGRIGPCTQRSHAFSPYSSPLPDKKNQGYEGKDQDYNGAREIRRQRCFLSFFALDCRTQRDPQTPPKTFSQRSFILHHELNCRVRPSSRANTRYQEHPGQGTSTTGPPETSAQGFVEPPEPTPTVLPNPPVENIHGNAYWTNEYGSEGIRGGVDT